MCEECENCRESMILIKDQYTFKNKNALLLGSEKIQSDIGYHTERILRLCPRNKDGRVRKSSRTTATFSEFYFKKKA